MSKANRDKTHCVNGHPFSKKNTHRDKHGHRKCRACRANQGRETMRRRRAEHFRAPNSNVPHGPCEHADCSREATVSVRMKTPESSTLHGTVQDFVYYCPVHYAVVDRLFFLCDVTEKAPAEAGAAGAVAEAA